MSGLSLGGLISGVDTDTLVEKLMELEYQRVTQQENRKAQLQQKQKAWQQVRTSLSTLRSKLDGIRFASIYRSRTATLSDESVATVTAQAGAVATTHRLEVVHLATQHVVASGTRNTATEQLGVSGTLELNDKAITIAETDNLYSIRDKINATAGIGLTASVVPVPAEGGIKYRLVLTAKETGEAGAIRMSGDLAQSLGFKPDGANYGTQELVPAQNAEFYLDGSRFETASNEVTDLLPGITITLKKGGATSSDPDGIASTIITVDTDVEKIATAIQDWVDALNESMALLSDLTSYNKETKEAGALQGDWLARNLQTALRSMLSKQTAGLPQGFSSLSDIGITTGQFGTANYGKVVVDQEKLKAKLRQDAEGVARVLGAIQQNVALASNGATVTASSVKAADGTHVYAVEDVINGETSTERYGFAGGGWASAAAPTADSPQWLAVQFAKAATVDEVQLYLAESANLKSYRVEYEESPGVWKTLAEVLNHDGASVKTLEFDPVVTSSIRLVVTETRDGGPVDGVTELMVMQQNTAPALEMYRYVNASLGAKGSLTIRNDGLSDQIADIDKQIDKITEQLEAKEASLRAQFEAMEEALAKIQSQGNLLLSQLGYATNSSSSR